MRYLSSFAIIVAIVLTFTSCSNDFELVEKGAEIPVVYGVLSAQDTATYIRVEKAFIDEKIGGDVLAKDAANLYFEDINVKLRHVSSGKEVILQRVDGNLEGYQRVEGIFADAPNYLYKIKRNQLNYVANEDYKLIIAKNDGPTLTESTTKILRPLSDDSNDVEPRNGTFFSFAYQSDFRVTWYPDVNSVIHDVILTVNYTEYLGSTATEKSVVWKAGINTSDRNAQSNSYSFVTKGRNFYEFMSSAIPVAGPNNPVTRVFKDITLRIVSGGHPIRDLIRIGQVNLGITSSGEIPTYTNMSNGARGIFTSKTEFIREGIGVSSLTLDSLRNGVITRNLNFK